jgi:hypothetical protein
VNRKDLGQGVSTCYRSRKSQTTSPGRVQLQPAAEVSELRLKSCERAKRTLINRYFVFEHKRPILDPHVG